MLSFQLQLLQRIVILKLAEQKGSVCIAKSFTNKVQRSQACVVSECTSKQSQVHTVEVDPSQCDLVRGSVVVQLHYLDKQLWVFLKHDFDSVFFLLLLSQLFQFFLIGRIAFHCSLSSPFTLDSFCFILLGFLLILMRVLQVPAPASSWPPSLLVFAKACGLSQCPGAFQQLP